MVRSHRNFTGYSKRLLLICLVLLFGMIGLCPQSQALTLPAHVDLSFKTTITAEKTYHPFTAGAVVFFPLKKYLFDALNDVPDISSFALHDINFSAPTVPTNSSHKVIIRLAYKTKLEDVPTPLVRSGVISLNQFKDGSFSTVHDSGFTQFRNALENDIKNSNPETRTLNEVFFVLKLEFIGNEDLDNSGLGSVDVDLKLNARAETSVEF